MEEKGEKKQKHFCSLAGGKAFGVYALYSPPCRENKLVIIGIIFIAWNNLLLSENRKATWKH